MLLAQSADIPATWIGVAGTVVTAFTTIITTLLVRIDKRLAAQTAVFDKRFLAIEQGLSDLAQSNLFRVISGDANANTKQEASAMLATMQRRRHNE